LVTGFALSFVIGYAIHEFYGLFFEFGWGWGITAAANRDCSAERFGALYPAWAGVKTSTLSSALAYE